MRPNDDDFNPLTEEEIRRLQEDEEFRRRVRREVLRMQSGEADTDIERDREEQKAEQDESDEAAEEYHPTPPGAQDDLALARVGRIIGFPARPAIRCSRAPLILLAHSSPTSFA